MGRGAHVAPGVTIGDGCTLQNDAPAAIERRALVAAGSVVTHGATDSSLAAGSPDERIRWVVGRHGQPLEPDGEHGGAGRAPESGSSSPAESSPGRPAGGGSRAVRQVSPVRRRRGRSAWS
ncbi:MAG: hypothetical protein KJ792_08420 [Actinobacteria bacterium]|nr:hypothetical protein [Actinomycetota bacterium]